MPTFKYFTRLNKWLAGAPVAEYSFAVLLARYVAGNDEISFFQRGEG